MASIIKVDEIKSQANGSALSIASGGAVTVNNGIADAGTISAGTIGSNVVFPSGHQIHIKSQDRTGVASVGSPASFYPTTTTDLATDSFYLQITSSEHSSFSKLRISFNTNFRINESTHAVIEARLVRWTGTGNVSSESTLLQGNIGSLTSTSIHYANYSGEVIDDISSIGAVQINYTVQYRCQGGNSLNAGDIYFGNDSNVKMQIHATGII